MSFASFFVLNAQLFIFQEHQHKERIGAGNFEYGNFENGNLDTNLISKIGWLVSSKISDGNFEFIIENGIFKNVVR